MGVYKLPGSIVDKISSAVARYFWGKTGPTRKLHWRNRETMCTPKILGGMRFKDLRVFNDALRGSQDW